MDMERTKRNTAGLRPAARRSGLFEVMIWVLLLAGCQTSQVTDNTRYIIEETGFPEFITPSTLYYITRIAEVPEIDPGSYRLEVDGLVENPVVFSLDQLYELDLEWVDLTLTIECIGNDTDGPLVSTAIWGGYPLYPLLVNLGVDPNAGVVRYEAADGYFASHTMTEVRENGVLMALHMNGEPIPPVHGFPIRVVSPGFHGVKQPAWVTRLTVLPDESHEDYWDRFGWRTFDPMKADSTIFTPEDGEVHPFDEPLRITGAAFGGGRIDRVEVTIDGGKSWTAAEIVNDSGEENVWVFWEAALRFPRRGYFTINARATDVHGGTQGDDDHDKYDGRNDWPVLTVTIR